MKAIAYEKTALSPGFPQAEGSRISCGVRNTEIIFDTDSLKLFRWYIFSDLVKQRGILLLRECGRLFRW